MPTVNEFVKAYNKMYTGAKGKAHLEDVRKQLAEKAPNAPQGIPDEFPEDESNNKEEEVKKEGEKEVKKEDERVDDTVKGESQPLGGDEGQAQNQPAQDEEKKDVVDNSDKTEKAEG